MTKNVNYRQFLFSILFLQLIFQEKLANEKAFIFEWNYPLGGLLSFGGMCSIKKQRGAHG